MKRITLILSLLFLIAGCTRDSQVVSRNLSYEADNFLITRRVIFFNGITGGYLLTIVGRCSIEDQKTQLEVTCKVGEDSYKKHFLGLSDNVSYMVEQLEAMPVSAYHYKVIFKPQVILPDVDFRFDTEELINNK